MTLYLSIILFIMIICGGNAAFFSDNDLLLSRVGFIVWATGVIGTIVNMMYSFFVILVDYRIISEW